MSNFHPLEVVGRSSETQLQVGENSNELTYRDKADSKTSQIRQTMSQKIFPLYIFYCKQ